MALVLELWANNARLELIEIRRVSGGDDPDDVNEYDCRHWYGPKPGPAVSVKHRYGDGAMVLARKALDALME